MFSSQCSEDLLSATVEKGMVIPRCFKKVFNSQCLRDVLSATVRKGMVLRGCWERSLIVHSHKCRHNTNAIVLLEHNCNCVVVKHLVTIYVPLETLSCLNENK